LTSSSTESFVQSTTNPAETKILHLSSTGEKVSDTRGQISWALSEFARSPYVSLVYVFVFAPYFANTVVGDPVRGQELWGLGNTIVGVFIAFLAPLLGAISDRMGRRKTWIAGISAIMVPCCFALWYAMPGAQGGLPIPVILVLAATLLACFMFSEVFHNAMLPSLVSAGRIGRLSGLGLAVGNSGTLLALIFMLTSIALPASGLVDWAFLPEKPLFGLDPETHEHNRIAGPIAGAWLVIFILPLLLWTPDRPSTAIGAKQAVGEGMKQVWMTVKRVRELKNVGIFLLARTLYTDGKVAILAYAGIYAAGIFQWELVEMLLFAILLAPFSISGGFIGGWLDSRFGSRRAIQITIGGTCIGMLGAVSSTPDQLLYFIPYDAAVAGPVWGSPYFQTLPELIYLVMFMLMASAITAAFAASRAMMARISPISMMSQFFGLYALSGSVTAFFGHGIVTLFTGVFNSQRAGFASVILLLFSGLVIMRWVREERAEELV
jgi:UMF1 family MFS transporter